MKTRYAKSALKNILYDVYVFGMCIYIYIHINTQTHMYVFTLHISPHVMFTPSSFTRYFPSDYFYLLQLSELFIFYF
jgi:hypothetical protein